MTTSENILFLLLGWMLGLFSPLIYDEIKKRQHKKEIRLGILTELKELRYKLMGFVYLMAKRNGEYDRALLEWLKPIVKDYSGTHRKDNFYIAIESHLKLSDEELLVISQQLKAKSKRGYSLKKYELPFLDSKIVNLTVFDESFQNHILEIKTQLKLIHEEIDQAKFYFEKTFDSTLSTENYQTIRDNLEDSYGNLSRQSRNLADRIGELATKLYY